MKQTLTILFALAASATAQAQTKVWNAGHTKSWYTNLPKGVTSDTAVYRHPQSTYDTTAHVSLPVLRRFVETVYTIGLNDAQRIRLNLALKEFEGKVQLKIDSADKPKKP